MTPRRAAKTSRIPTLAKGRAAAALVAFFAILAAALVASGYLGDPAVAETTPGTAVTNLSTTVTNLSTTGTNPSTAVIRGKLRDAAVASGIPPKILYGIAYQESTWRQFDANGNPLIGSDGKGIGIMQVTSYDLFGFDVEKLKTDIDYNIACGVEVLLEKRTWTPVIGDGDARCYENWFYAVWAYNGWTKNNDYPYTVWKHIADGRDRWTGLAVTPVSESALKDGLGVAVDTPQPEHWWSPVPLPKPTLGAPRAPKRVAAGARFTVSGGLSPRHPAGDRSVEIRCYRFNGSAWVLRRTVAATNRDSGEATRYVARFALAKRGRWKLRAYAPADADHAAASSAVRYVTVR